MAQDAPDANYSVLVNDLEIHVDQGHRVLYVDGYCPREAWTQSTLIPPRPREATLLVYGARDLRRGESRRLTATPTEWVSAFDERGGWLCIGEPSPSQAAQAVQINDRTVLVVSDDNLTAIWLVVMARGVSE